MEARVPCLAAARGSRHSAGHHSARAVPPPQAPPISTPKIKPSNSIPQNRLILSDSFNKMLIIPGKDHKGIQFYNLENNKIQSKSINI